MIYDMESGRREREREREKRVFKKEGIKQKRVSLVWLFSVVPIKIMACRR